MLFNFLIRIAEHPPKADKSAPTGIWIILLKIIIAPLLLPFVKWQRYDLRRRAFSTYVDVYRFAHNSK
jgi:hypothetical protein